jgi:endonuclease YncB( thermonuclease family)
MKKLLTIVTMFFLINGSANAHSGGTNSEGCHNQKSNNTYHCHNPKKKSENLSTKYFLKIVDGDTIYIGKKKYRFSGIDAPEIKQTCEKDGVIFLCGVKAKKILQNKISNYKVTCIEEQEKDYYKRILAECFVNGESLSTHMVRSGYAFAFRKYSKKFIKDEEFAKTNKLGLWKSKFEYPWDVR